MSEHAAEYSVYISLLCTGDGYKLLVWSFENGELVFLAIRKLPEEIEA